MIITNKLYLLIMLILFSCSKEEKSFLINLENKIEQQQDSTIISINKLTNFEWDTLYIFKPYTSNDFINNFLNKPDWLNPETSSIIGSESYTLFVFKRKNEIVNDFMVPRKISKEFGFLNVIKYNKKDAIFLSIKDDYVIKNIDN